MALRSSKSLAAVLGTIGNTVVGVLALAAAVTHPIATPPDDPDGPIATAPAELTATPPPATTSPESTTPAPDATVAQTPTNAGDEQTLAAAVKPSVKPAEVTWAANDDRTLTTWAQPKLKGFVAFAGQYEPRFDLHLASSVGGGDQTQLEFSLGRDHDRDRDSPKQQQLSRIGFTAPGQATPAVRKKGHWFVFAAGGSNAVGLNILRDPSGELRRAGWSSEHVAAVGSGQVGIGWRRGGLQASFGAVERELSAYGRSVNERFLAFTLSFSPGAMPSRGPSGQVRAWMERDDRYDARRR
jgi:hypothetical protein